MYQEKCNVESIFQLICDSIFNGRGILFLLLATVFKTNYNHYTINQEAQNT